MSATLCEIGSRPVVIGARISRDPRVHGRVIPPRLDLCRPYSCALPGDVRCSSARATRRTSGIARSVRRCRCLRIPDQSCAWTLSPYLDQGPTDDARVLREKGRPNSRTNVEAIFQRSSARRRDRSMVAERLAADNGDPRRGRSCADRRSHLADVLDWRGSDVCERRPR